MGGDKFVDRRASYWRRAKFSTWRDARERKVPQSICQGVAAFSRSTADSLSTLIKATTWSEPEEEISAGQAEYVALLETIGASIQ